MLLKLLEMLNRIKEKIGEEATIEVFPNMDGEGLCFKVKCVIRDELFSWRLNVGKVELSVTNIEDFEAYLEDRIVYLARLAIEKRKNGN